MTPRTIEEYLDQLRAAMRNDDPALVQDALYDAEEYLRSELREQSNRDSAEVLAEIFASYGAPEEVAAAYRETERTVVKALASPPRPEPRSLFGHVFGVFIDPRAYTSIIYMLVALATGILYFTVAVVGLSLSAGLSITIIGIPLFLLFLALVRVLSLVEGRIVEVMLGVRMPRRPLYPSTEMGFWARVGNMFTDGRTWTTLLYMVLMLPLGVCYFATVVVGFVVSMALMAVPFAYYFGQGVIAVDTWRWSLDGHSFNVPSVIEVWLAAGFGFVLFIVMMHLCRLVGRMHGNIAKYFLVRI